MVKVLTQGSVKELNLCFNIMNVKLCLFNLNKDQKWILFLSSFLRYLVIY